MGQQQKILKKQGARKGTEKILLMVFYVFPCNRFLIKSWDDFLFVALDVCNKNIKRIAFIAVVKVLDWK